MMELPRLDDPARYAGLYVFDFGDQCAVGYTAAEVATLLEHERYRGGKVYRIHRATPDGRMELAGVSIERFMAEDGVFFYRSVGALAGEDYDELVAVGEGQRPPCRAKVQLAALPGATLGHVTALLYPAEYTEAMGRWLMEAGFRGGDVVEGGISQVTDYYQAGAKVVRRAQLWGVQDGTSRSAEAVLATTHVAVQR